MAKHGGFPGGMMPGNMGQLMKQAQKMQRQMEEKQAEAENLEYTAAAGGGVVKITMNGKKEITAVVIDPEAVDPDDVETLQDLVMAAANEAIREIEKKSSELIGQVTGGLGGFGGGFPF
ncbi:MAG: YbaB/EbfC family nucleoid-associated protein [Lachnospiraceae bacterium]|nr:YbaB/EbfC family nucleoid-associated protein [Lachnospiraceae bacterium]